MYIIHFRLFVKMDASQFAPKATELLCRYKKVLPENSFVSLTIKLFSIILSSTVPHQLMFQTVLLP